jgi:hypothetical protein
MVKVFTVAQPFTAGLAKLTNRFLAPLGAKAPQIESIAPRDPRRERLGYKKAIPA